MSLRSYLFIIFQFSFFSFFSQQENNRISPDLLEFAKQNNLTASEFQYILNKSKNQQLQISKANDQEKVNSTSCAGNNVANIGFEQGNFNGWTIQGGFNNSLYPDSINIGQVVPVTTLVTGGVDATTNFSLTSPLGGNKVVKMNDDIANGGVTILKTKFRITSQTQFLKTAFSLVMQMAGHQCKLNPYFKIEVYNCNETTKLEEYFTLMQEFPCAGQAVLSSTLVPGFYSTNWRVHCFDFSNYLNSTITIKISMADCAIPGHWAYGYFDAGFEQASPSTLIYNYSINNTNLTFNQSDAVTCYTNGVNVTLPNGQVNYSTYCPTMPQFSSSTQAYSFTNTGTAFILMDNVTHNCVQQQRIRVGNTPTLVLTPLTASACPSAQYTINISGASSYYSLQPYTNLSPTSAAVFTTVPTTYTFVGANGGGLCVDTSTIYVPIYAVFPLTITPVTQTICSLGSATIAAFGANTYTWNNVSNASSIVVTPTLTNTSYNVHGHDVNGCHLALVSSSVTSVTTNTTLIFGAFTYTICPGDSTSVTANGPSALSYSWSNGGTVASVYLKPPATSIFTVWATTACGIISNTVLITVKPIIPIALTITSPTITCANTPFSINCTGATNYTFVGTNTVANTSGNAFIDLPASASSFTIKAKHIPNCYYTTSIVPVSVLPLPSLTITPSSQTVCAGQQVTVTGQSANTYTWKNNFFATVATGAIASFSPNPGISSTHYLQGADANGCIGTQSFVAYAEPNWLTISQTQYTMCLSSTSPVTLTPYNMNDANNTYTWNSSIVSYSFSDTPTVTTTYTLQSYNAACGFTTAYATVTVFPSYGPTITAAVNPTLLCAGQTVTFTMSGANKYSSSYFNLTTSTIVNQVINTATTSCNVIGYDIYGCSSASITLALNAAAQPTLNAFPTQTICPGKTLTLTVTGASTYSWSTNQTSTVIIVSPTVSTTYTVYGFSANNVCYAIKTKSVVAYPSPTLFVTPSISPSICPGGSVNLTAYSVSNSANSYTWNTTVLNNVFPVSPSVQTTYTLVGQDLNNTNCFDTLLVTVGIYNLPNLSLTIQNPVTCSGTATISAIASPTGGVFTPSVYASNQFGPGIHSLQYKYQDPSTNCKNTISQNFTINPNPCVSIWSSIDTICLSQTATLNTSPLGGTITGQYLSGNTFSPSVANGYLFAYSYFDSNGCYGSSCTDIFVMMCATNEKKFSELNELTIFPNPFNSSFKINNPTGESFKFQILDINGRSIEENIIYESKEINLSDQPSGIYLIRIEPLGQSHLSKSYKLIKN